MTSTTAISPVASAPYIRWTERDLVPDFLIRYGIRRLCADRLREEAAMGRRALFIDGLRTSPIAIRTEAANEQHYEVPADFYRLVLGPHLKYSSAVWPHGVTELAEAEAATLALTCDRAQLADGQDVLELGCGWGSLSLFMAARYPRSRFLGVSNSHSQKVHIDGEARRRGLDNLEIVTADMNEFAANRKFDRVVSVEMFEHMRNYQELLRRISTWCKPDARLFVHIFTHSRFTYPFEVLDSSDWMAEHFFTGGQMPSDDLLLEFDDDFRVQEHWRMSGANYQKTAEAWLMNLDHHRAEVMALFERVYGKDEALKWVVRWRIFFMACAELFGYRGGNEWLVSHYLFVPRNPR